MVIASSFLLLVIATGLRSTALEAAVTIGVLILRRVMTTTLTTWASIVLSTMSVGTSATSGRVCGLSQNNKCSFTSIRVYANGGKTERIKIFSGVF